ncbi:MAG: methyltransferase domain-containing protein, partial [Actinomycetota bacterium]|nr:methyltransferase domain-containing protein [Actinomycetota bacterium]MDQ6947661.1 methyltransferase domain-containing protein [Actinomycetota bacterium]
GSGGGGGGGSGGGGGAGGQRHPRPNISTPFAAPRTETERTLTEIWGSQLGLEKVGIHDRFFDLGGHSLLAVQVASEIRDRFQIEMPVLMLFKAPTISELAVLVEQAEVSGGVSDAPVISPALAAIAGTNNDGLAIEGPGGAAKASYREFYDDVTRRLETTGMGEASFFLNYGYLSLGDQDEAVFEVPDGVFNPSSIRLAFELVGATPLSGRRVLDVGCGRGGTVSLLAERFGAEPVGVDLSPEAVAFCRRTHRHPAVSFEVSDAENLPFEDRSFDVVTNLESSHTYPDMRAFLAEARRVLRAGGWFLHADLLAGQRWMEVQALLTTMGFTVENNRDITANVLASCDEVANNRTKAFGERSAVIDNFLAIPGSPVYTQMASGAWEYRILRSRLK